MSSLEEVISILKPRKGDQTNLIPVKSKVAQDALIYNAQTSYLLDPKSSKPGKSLSLSHPYYKVVHTNSFVGDDMIPEADSKPLYEYVHIPTVRMLRWIELSAERKRAKSRQQIKRSFPLRRLHDDCDDTIMNSFDEVPKEKNKNVDGTRPWRTDRDLFASPEIELLEPVHRAPEGKKMECTISTTMSHRPQENDEANTNRANCNLSATSTEGLHESQQNMRPQTAALQHANPHLSKVRYLRADKPDISRFAKIQKREDSPEPEPKRAVSQDTVPAPPRTEDVELYLKEQVHSQRISTGGTLDLDNEQHNIQANYQKLTKNLVNWGMLRSSSVQCDRLSFPMSCNSRFGEDELSIFKKISASDGRTIYLGRFAGPPKGGFFVLYQWHKGTSWEAARAWKALQIVGIPKCCVVHQYLNGSHSFMESPGQPSERHCTYAETGFTMIKSDTPMYALSYFISRRAPEAVMRTIFYQLFARYRALAFKRIVHYFLSPESIFISVSDQEENQGLSVFPLLWDYSIDRVMFTDRKAQFFSTRDSDLGLYADADKKPYEGFFADLLAMHGLLAACCPEAVKCLQLLTEKISAYKNAKEGYGFTVTPSFFTLLQSELDCDVQAVREFMNENATENDSIA